MNKYMKKVYFLVDKIIVFYVKEEVEECVSHVFLAIWEDINQYDESKGSFSSFVFMKTKYKALDYKRKLENKSEKYNVLEESLPDNMSTEGIVLDKENSLEIINIINSFKEHDKTYFYLRYFMYYKIEEIAIKHKTIRASVENRLYRCRLNNKQNYKYF